jgi:DNA-binding CsgD family transcriptional regulator
MQLFSGKKQETEQPRPDVGFVSVTAMLPILSAGFALAYASFLIAIFGGSPVYGLQAEDTPAFALRIAVLAGFSVCLVVFVACQTAFDKLWERAVFLPAAVTVPAVALAALEPCLRLVGWPWGMGLHASCWFLFGCGIAFITMAWYKMFTVAWKKSVSRSIATAAVLSAVMFLFVNNLKAPFGQVAMLLLPWASVLVYRLDLRYVGSLSGHQRAVQGSARLRITTGIIVLLYGVLFGFVTFQLMRSLGHSEFSLVFSGAMLCAALILLAVIKWRRYIPYSTIMKVLLPLVIGGFLSLLWPDAMANLISYAFLLLLFSTYEIANQYTLIAIGSDSATEVVRTLAHGRLSPLLGMIGGWLLCLVFFNDATLGTDTVVIAATGLIVVLATLAVIFPIRSNLVDEKQEWNLKRESFKARCEGIAHHYGLSSREHEVLVLLAKGRNAQFIGQDLCISQYTAKTHIYHVYQKLGINSHQELISIVDGIKER